MTHHILMAYLYISLFALFGGLIFRLYGADESARFGISKNWMALLFTLGYAFITPMEYSLIVWAATFAAMVTGHGNGQDLGTFIQSADNYKKEKIEFLIYWLKGDISDYWYDVVFLAVNGFLITLLAGIFTGSWLIALSGLILRPLAYMIGRWSAKYQRTLEPTMIGECLTGFFFYAALGYYIHHHFFMFL